MPQSVLTGFWESAACILMVLEMATVVYIT